MIIIMLACAMTLAMLIATAFAVYDEGRKVEDIRRDQLDGFGFIRVRERR